MTSSKQTEDCKHKWQADYEDHILMGSIYYGEVCAKCGVTKPAPPGPLELGTYR